MSQEFQMTDFPVDCRADLNELKDDSLGKALGCSGENNIPMELHRDSILDMQIPANGLDFDEVEFKSLLANSLSLSFEEKRAIVNQVAELQQVQVDSLAEILKEEEEKFEQLNNKRIDEEKKLFA